MEHHHATLYCVKEAIDDTPMGKFIRMVLAFVAEMEREKIMDRTTTGRINKAKAGKVVSGSKAPYGWTWLYDDRGEKTVVIDEEQAAILKWLAEQYADGVAAYNLMNQLNERGVPAPLGQEWSHQTVVRLLSDPRITGKGAKIFAYQQRKTKQPLEPIDLPDGTYPAIISEELFARIQQRREVNKADAIRASKEPEQYLLRAGFVRCGHCNKPMMAVKHRSQYIYRCTHTDLNHTNVILAHPLDAQIWDWLQQLADHVTLIETAIELATSSGKREHDTAAIEHSIAIWQTKAQNYLSDLDDATLIEDTRTAVRSALNNATKIIIQLEEERAQIMAGRVDKERERAAYQEILAWCNQVKEGRAELTYQRKRDFLRMLGVVVVVQNQKPYYQHMDYRIQVALPTIQELLTPHALVNCGASSPEDIQVTEQLVQAGRLLDIELVDHIIIGNQRYVSLKERLRW